MNKKNILITGVAGLLGSNLADWIIENKKNYNVIGEDKTFFIFSDDIKWCENNLNFIKNKIYCKDNEDYEDLYLMSMCENNIIANSTFSWWGAWLNQDKKNKIISPKNWFGPSNSHLDTKDIYLYDWIII